MDKVVEQFKCRYFQLVSINHFSLLKDENGEEEEKVLRDPVFQERLLDEVLLQETLEVPRHYTLSIMKWLMRILDRRSIEIDERMTELYASLVSVRQETSPISSQSNLSSGHQSSNLGPPPVPQEAVLVRYFYRPDRYFSILESPSILAAHGTTGFKTWEAALALGNHLLDRPDLVQGKSVLELGAGTGFTSILCAKLGASSVLATDGSDEMVELIGTNMRTNNVQESVKCRKLWFGHHIGLEEDVFDLILGADVTYDDSILDPLCDTISYLLQRHASTKVLIAATLRKQTT